MNANLLLLFRCHSCARILQYIISMSRRKEAYTDRMLAVGAPNSIFPQSNGFL